MYDSTLTPLSGAALFSPADCYEVNQLADLLFDPEERTICLKSEHEIVTRTWVLSALHKSNLAKKGADQPAIYWASVDSEQATLLENVWIYSDNGKLLRANSDKESTRKKASTLTFPTLSLEQRVKVLHHMCVDTLQTHLLTIPTQTIKKALEWQSRYCADQQVLAETISILRRAVNRFLLTHADHQQTSTLEFHHIAEVLVDWQHVSLTDLLRSTEDNVELKLFLSEHVIGQSLAIERFSQSKAQTKFFILAGTQYSGKKTFIERYAQFTHGAKCFCISFDLSFFSSDASWSDIFLPAPNHHTRLSLVALVKHYPQAIIMLSNAEENPVLLERLQREIKRSFLQINEQCISIDGISWMLLCDTKIAEPTPIAVQESIFVDNSSVELSDILYQPRRHSLPSFSEPVQKEKSSEWDEQYILNAVKEKFSETVLKEACLLPFSPLTEKDKKNILSKEIKRIVQCLRTAHDISVYYQEEVIHFLLSQVNKENKGFEILHHNLYQQIEQVFLKSLEQGVIADGQVLMLQLNDTGRVLQIVRTVARAGATQVKLKI